MKILSTLDVFAKGNHSPRSGRIRGNWQVFRMENASGSARCRESKKNYTNTAHKSVIAPSCCGKWGEQSARTYGQLCGCIFNSIWGKNANSVAWQEKLWEAWVCCYGALTIILTKRLTHKKTPDRQHRRGSSSELISKTQIWGIVQKASWTYSLPVSCCFPWRVLPAALGKSGSFFHTVETSQHWIGL